MCNDKHNEETTKQYSINKFIDHEAKCIKRKTILPWGNVTQDYIYAHITLISLVSFIVIDL